MRLNLEGRGVRILAVAVIAVLLGLLAWREGQPRWQAFAQWPALAQAALALRAGETLTADDLQRAAKARGISIETLEAGSEAWLLSCHLQDAHALQDWLLQLETEGARPLRWGLRRDDAALHFELALQR